MGEANASTLSHEDPSGWFVTGAAGFIGSNFCRYLLSAGTRVIGFDNFFTGTRENVDRLKRLGGNRFQMIEGSILDIDAVAYALNGCKKVVHLAAQVSVQRSIEDARETHDINSTGFLNVLSTATQAAVEHFIYASSCAVYGDNPNLPLSEAEKPAPLSPYAATKLSNEIYAAGFARADDRLAVTGLRFFNIFGDRKSVV